MAEFNGCVNNKFQLIKKLKVNFFYKY